MSTILVSLAIGFLAGAASIVWLNAEKPRKGGRINRRAPYPRQTTAEFPLDKWDR